MYRHILAVQTEIETLFESTARLIAHPLSYRLNSGNFYQYIEQIRAAIMSPV